VIHKIENEDECLDIEKREGPDGLRLPLPLEVALLAIGRIAMTFRDVRRDARRRWKLGTIRLVEIKLPKRVSGIVHILMGMKGHKLGLVDSRSNS
jgi:hypothetical protein